MIDKTDIAENTRSIETSAPDAAPEVDPVVAPDVAPDAAPDVAAEAARLVAGLVAEPWGQTSASVYETGRVVTLAPWLPGQDGRLRFLRGRQRPDGGWGGPGGYALVPTLSATEAILTVLLDDTGAYGPAPGDLVETARRALDRLFAWLNHGPLPELPDMPAIELIVPALVEAINAHLAALDGLPLPGLDPWRGARLGLPPGMDGRLLAVLRDRIASGSGVPEKLLHALEIGGPAAAGAPGVRPLGPGTVGASPAATAAWLAGGDRGSLAAGARRHLADVAGGYGGPVPCALPISVFERGWVVGGLLRAGVPVAVPPEVTAELATAYRPAGVCAGPGLPADADTTSGALYALYAMGPAAPREAPESLSAFRTPTHFCTWQGEQGFSVTVNAHVLEAFGGYLAGATEEEKRYSADVAALSRLLADRQEPDGSWHDRWHASPYYATACCALALDAYGVGAPAAAAVRRAARWVLDTQRADGSWGLWEGTAEETAYALQILLSLPPDEAPSYRRAAERGHAYLLRTDPERHGPAMWHDKDLYYPTAVVRSAILAALHLAAVRLSHCPS